MPSEEKSLRDRPVTVRELDSALVIMGGINNTVGFINKALFGETSKGPDDQFGEVGKAVAESVATYTRLIDGLRAAIATEEGLRDG